MIFTTWSIALLLLICAPFQEEEIEDPPDPIEAAFETFSKAPIETKNAVLAEIYTRIGQSDDASLVKQRSMVSSAKKELTIKQKPKRKYYEPKKYAPLFPRCFASKKNAGSEIQMKVAIFRPWESEPPFMARIIYDFGTNIAYDSGSNPIPEDALWDLLHGYCPGDDIIVAWLMKKLDFNSDLDKQAIHFSHVYCDLEGKAFKEITLYDAFASGEKLDMPDGDVIPFARHILKDNTFVSPIPPTQKRTLLYEQIKDHFLIYFRHRTWIEAAANIYVNPDAEVRPQHNPLRKRLLYAFALDDGDIDKICARFIKAKDRKKFIRQTDKLAIDDPLEEKKTNRFIIEQNKSRWAIALISYAVLRDYNFLQDQ